MTNLRRALFILLVCAAAAFVVPSTANAATGCRTDRYGSMASTMCTGGGQYATAMTCRNWLGWSAYAQGPRVYPWQYSNAWCPAGYGIVSTWVLHY